MDIKCQYCGKNLATIEGWEEILSQVRLYLHVDFAEDYITEHYTG